MKLARAEEGERNHRRRQGVGLVDIVFCGNPGSGKSTLISSISRMEFKSKNSWGVGLTRELCFQTNPAIPNVRYADTPGVADIEHAQKAAVAISKALNDAAGTGRIVKIFFVVTVEAVRVRPSDRMTIKMVLGSIHLDDNAQLPANCYGVIVNKCEFLETKDFIEKGKKFIELTFGAKTQTKVPTIFVKFVPRIEELVNGENMIYPIDGLREWVQNIPGLSTIKSADMMDVHDMEERLKAAKKEYKEKRDQLERRYANEQSKLWAELKETKQQFQETKMDLQQMKKDQEKIKEELKKFKNFFIITLKRARHKSIHLKNGIIRKGTIIHLWDKVSEGHEYYGNQLWKWDGNRIVSYINSGLCLHMENNKPKRGNKIHLWGTNGVTANMLWRLEGSTISSIKHPAWCWRIEESGGEYNGTRIELYDQKRHPDAEWVIEYTNRTF